MQQNIKLRVELHVEWFTFSRLVKGNTLRCWMSTKTKSKVDAVVSMETPASMDGIHPEDLTVLLNIEAVITHEPGVCDVSISDDSIIFMAGDTELHRFSAVTLGPSWPTYVQRAVTSHLE